MEHLFEYLSGLGGLWPYVLVFAILLGCGLGVPIPEDVTLFCAGLLAYYGNCQIWIMIIVCFLGVMLGDSVIFLLGRRYGMALSQARFFRNFLRPERLETVKTQFRERGYKLLFLARFMPGFRAPIFFSAGTLQVPFRTFITHDGSAALISVPTIVYLVYAFGDEVDEIIHRIEKVNLFIFGFVAIYIGIKIAMWWMRFRAEHSEKAS